jgi:hypothetical protein
MRTLQILESQRRRSPQELGPFKGFCLAFAREVLMIARSAETQDPDWPNPR